MAALEDLEGRRGEPPPSALEELDAQMRAGRFLTAYRALAEFAPPEQWRSTNALCEASRLLRHVGAPDLGARLALRAYRCTPDSAEARYWVGMDRLEAHGPLATFHWFASWSSASTGTPKSLTGIAWLRAATFSAFRDFDAAERELAEADRIVPEDPYTESLRISILAHQDEYDQALERARDAVRRHPGHRALVQTLAAQLELRGSFEEAIEVLLRASSRMESGAVEIQAAQLLLEVGRYGDAAACVDRAEAAFPIAEEPLRKAMAGARSDIAYFSGDDERAILEARRAGGTVFEALAERIATNRSGRRVLLPVGFVRQHHLTCVPATLSTLAAFWGRSVDHLELADAICFNGTRGHAARRWARQHAWKNREFTVTWDNARRLLDAGVPFTIDSVQATSAHVRAVVGYDERRGTLLLRDPYVPRRLEALAVDYLELFRAHGPRGLVLLPSESDGAVSALQLDDEDLYDTLDEIEQALDEHDRRKAATLAAELDSRHPSHRLTLLAQRAIAAYDSDPIELRRLLERALSTFPDEPTLLLSLFSTLKATATPAEVSEYLNGICTKKDAHPVFHELLAVELLDDNRRAEEATRMLRKVARVLPDRASTIGYMARAAWQARDFERALTLFRFAACADPTNDGWAAAYHGAATAMSRADQSFAFLKHRAARYAQRSSAPARTLFTALEGGDRSDAAFDVLASALDTHPEDGALLLFAAESHARYGQFESARGRLEQARPFSSRAEWLRSAAEVEANAGEHLLALEYSEETARAEPRSAHSHEAVVRRLSALHGQARAVAYAREVAGRFPENAELLALYARVSSNEEPPVREAALRKLTALQPANAWAQRELSLLLGMLGRRDEARTLAELALKLAPHDLSGSLVHARIAELSLDQEAADKAYSRALELSADAVLAVDALIQSSPNTAETLRRLRSIEALVVAKSRSGDGIHAFYRAARRHLPIDEMRRSISVLREKRADCWAVWLVAMDHERTTGSLDRAIEIGEAATARFPLSPALWVELAEAYRLAGRPDHEMARIERATSLVPGGTRAVQLHADALLRSGAKDRGLSALERGLRFSPQDPVLQLERAETLWALDRREEALSAVSRLISANPSDALAWRRLTAWMKRQGAGEKATELVRTLIQRRPWDAQLLLRASEMESSLDAALELIDRAIELDPNALEAHDLKAITAARNGQHGLALAACRPKGLGAHIPVELCGREAWLKAAFGDIAGAIAAMTAVVADRPDYAFGHRCLAEWATEKGDKELELKASEALVRVEPGAAMAYGYLGQALEKLARMEDAQRAFRRAAEIDPSYAFATHRYVSLLLREEEFDRARRAIARVASHVSRADAALDTLRIAVAERKRQEATSAAKMIFLDRDAPPGVALAAFDTLSKEIPISLYEMLNELVFEPDVPARVGQFWAESALGRSKVLGSGPLTRLRRSSPEAAEAAMSVVLQHYGEKQRFWPAFWLLVRNFSFVRSREAPWGAMGYVFVRHNLRAFTILWLSSYRRHAPEPWMLLNLALALRMLGFGGAASRVSRHALTLAPDQSQAKHAIFVALESVLSGDMDAAEPMIADLAQAQLIGYMEHQRDLLRAIVVLCHAKASDRDSAAFDAWNHLGLIHPTPFASCFRLDGIERRRLSRRLARIDGTFSALVRGYWDSVLAPAILVALGALIITGEGQRLVPVLVTFVFFMALRPRV